jgi:hypothetical protein
MPNFPAMCDTAPVTRTVLARQQLNGFPKFGFLQAEGGDSIFQGSDEADVSWANSPTSEEKSAKKQQEKDILAEERKKKAAAAKAKAQKVPYLLLFVCVRESAVCGCELTHRPQ